MKHLPTYLLNKIGHSAGATAIISSSIRLCMIPKYRSIGNVYHLTKCTKLGRHNPIVIPHLWNNVEHLRNTCGTLTEHLRNTCGTLVEYLWTLVKQRWNKGETKVKQRWNNPGTGYLESSCMIQKHIDLYMKCLSCDKVQKIWNASRICVSSLRRGHANLLCIVPILVYVLPKQVQLESLLPSLYSTWSQANHTKGVQGIWGH